MTKEVNGVDVMSKRPAYLGMYEHLKKEIINGIFTVGELLPTESEFEQQFEVSRTTVRRAMDLLSRDGLIEIKQGRGTMVLDYKTKQNLNKVTSVSESLKRRGYTVKTKSMYIDVIKATVSLAKDLSIELGDDVARIQRIQLADDKPITIMKNYIVYSNVPHIEQYTNKFYALYQFLEDQYQIHIDGAVDKISAKSADFADSEMLSVPVGTALLCIYRICYQNNMPVCVDNVSIVGDQYELESSMTGRFK